jgi:hypothetical protein
VGLQVVQVALALEQGDPLTVEDGDAGGIIPTVFKAAQSLKKSLRDVAITDVSYDAAHVS